ncbi:MAG: group II truncated hemoglobin [Bdellovibrionales bacterium]|nr:group II truncated hemoglobin [Bdellovibrionales bacterium]
MDNPHYKAVGEEAGIKELVKVFYDKMDSDPALKTIRDLHAEDLTEARDKLFEFLVGWMGGPPLYEQKYGHPRLRMRHMPFPIGEVERDQWMLCMRHAMEVCNIPEVTKKQLDERFYQVADFMRNT